jgi:hypothetical protein
MGGVPVYDPDDDGHKHPLPVLTTYIPGGYRLTIKEKHSSSHMTWLCVGEPCDPTTVYFYIIYNIKDYKNDIWSSLINKTLDQTVYSLVWSSLVWKLQSSLRTVQLSSDQQPVYSLML